MLISSVVLVPAVVLLGLLFPALAPVYPSRSSGFAGTIVIALLAMGVLALVARWISSPSQRRRRR